MLSKSFTIDVAGEAISATFDAGDAGPAPTLILAHGAGGHMRDRSMQSLMGELCRRGMHVVRFNFPYREHKRARPDSMPLLMDAIAAAASRARNEIQASSWLLGGRSMGGRASSTATT